MNMAVVRDKKKGKVDKASLDDGGEIVQRKSVFGKYTDAEMLSQLRELALDPCKSGLARDSIRPLWNQILRVRKLMTLSSSECPLRKRKLQQFLKDKQEGASGLVSAYSSQQKVAKRSRGQSSHASSESSLLNTSSTTEFFCQKTSLKCSSGSLVTAEGNFLGEHGSTGLSFPDNETAWVQSIKDNSSLMDVDESVSGSNPLSPGNPSYNESPAGDDYDSVYWSNLISDNFQRMTIPIGPRFQADVPDWSGPLDKRHMESADCESSKWLGTRIWPSDYQDIEATERVVGKGRPTSCSCVCSGSTDCIKLHIEEERLSLQSDLGPAFFSWKFNEMGEVVSLTWTVKEQKNFEVLMKKKSNNSLKRALNSFPDKSKQDILSYFLNVFMPRHMSLRIRAFPEKFDSDDEKLDDVESGLKGKRSKSIVSGSKDVRARYLLRR